MGLEVVLPPDFSLTEQVTAVADITGVWTSWTQQQNSQWQGLEPRSLRQWAVWANINARTNIAGLGAPASPAASQGGSWM